MKFKYKKYVIILCINIVYKNCVKILLNKVKAQQKNKKIIKKIKNKVKNEKIKNNKIKNIV